MKLAVALALAAGLALGACETSAPSPEVNIPLPGHPFAVVPTNDGCWLFVSFPAGRIGVLRRDNGRVELVRTVKVKGSPAGMTLTPDRKYLIAAAGALVLFLNVKRLISGNGNPVAASITDGEKAGSVYVNVSADGKLLFISDERAQTVSVVDLAHGRIGAIPVGRAPIALTFSKDGRYLYTTSEVAAAEWNWPRACKLEGRGRTEAVNPEGAVVVIDVERSRSDPAQAVVSRVPAGCSPVRMAISPDGDRVYVTARNSDAVLAFDTAKLVSDPGHARVGMAAVGTAPVPVVVVNGGKTVIAGNSNRFGGDPSRQQMLDVLTADPLAVEGHIPAGAFPREMRLSSDGATLFLTNFSSDSLEVIDWKRSIR